MRTPKPSSIPQYEGPLLADDVKPQMTKEERELFEDLLLKMLRYRPEKRLSMQDVLRHDWFKYE
jgi:serine/threonine protein kinase